MVKNTVDLLLEDIWNAATLEARAQAVATYRTYWDAMTIKRIHEASNTTPEEKEE